MTSTIVFFNFQRMVQIMEHFESYPSSYEANLRVAKNRGRKHHWQALRTQTSLANMATTKVKEIDAEGNVYKGDVLDGERHGQGILLYAGTGDVYQGDFENRLQHGTGKFIRGGQIEGNKDGMYEGLWQEGILTQVKKGKARIELENGDVYDGGFNHWKRHGKGKLVEYNGAVYDGQWKNGLRDGPGKQTYPDGYVFKGKFNQGKKNEEKTTSNSAPNILLKTPILFPKGKPVKDGTHKEARLEVASVALNPYQGEPQEPTTPRSSTMKNSKTSLKRTPKTSSRKMTKDPQVNRELRDNAHRPQTRKSEREVEVSYVDSNHISSTKSQLSPHLQHL